MLVKVEVNTSLDAEDAGETGIAGSQIIEVALLGGCSKGMAGR